MKTHFRTMYFFVAVALGAAGGAVGIALVPHAVSQPSHAADVVAGKVTSPVAQPFELSAAFKQTAKSIRPAVVSISTVKKFKAAKATAPRQRRPEIPDELRRFFGGEDPFERFSQSPDSPQREFEQQGLGSGVIISADGYVLTNNHVVQGGDEVTVTLSDDRAYKAQVVGTDRGTDLAVLRIKATGLAYAELGDSDALEIGEWVLAVGSPMGLDQTVTAGIISAKGRHVGITQGGYEDFLQTDAAINPGNSGGPLVNLKGQVVGINTAIASRSGGSMGIGFAVPSSIAKTVLDQILKSGKVTRGRIGAGIQDLTEDLAQSFQFKSRHGVLISDVLPDSPAAKAGLKTGDIVTKYDGRPVRSANQFRNSVAATKPGTKAELEIFRNGNPLTAHVVIGELDEKEVAAVGTESSSESSESMGLLGLSVQTLTQELAKQYGIKEPLKGVVVTDVEPSSPSAKAGIRAQDVIVNIGGKDVQTVQEFKDTMKQQKLEAGVRMQVVRDGFNRFVFLKNGN